MNYCPDCGGECKSAELLYNMYSTNGNFNGYFNGGFGGIAAGINSHGTSNVGVIAGGFTGKTDGTIASKTNIANLCSQPIITADCYSKQPIYIAGQKSDIIYYIWFSFVFFVSFMFIFVFTSIS